MKSKLLSLDFIFRIKLKAVSKFKNCIKVEAHEMAYLFRSELEEKEQTLAEVRTKFSKNKQILTSNWEQAEAEVSPVILYPGLRNWDSVPF